MITKKRNRYYCEYCKKTGGNSYWMKRHEERCTLNPNRYCGYCQLLEVPQPDLKELIALLPDPNEYKTVDEYGSLSFRSDFCKAVEDIMPKLREKANNCPTCIMAALRQKKIPVPIATDFDFKKECQNIWADFNESQSKE